jgi:hypothetical protein
VTPSRTKAETSTKYGQTPIDVKSKYILDDNARLALLGTNFKGSGLGGITRSWCGIISNNGMAGLVKVVHTDNVFWPLGTSASQWNGRRIA